jgi:calcium/calmodulin-dependent protein kinase (CaM kinase) II
MDSTKKLLEAISVGDWDTYAAFSDAKTTCFEPETCGQQVEGLAFHKFYFNLPSGSPDAPKATTTIASPIVRVIGDVGLVTYNRVVQRADADGVPKTSISQETRVWHRQADGQWRNIHSHRSNL